MATGTQQSSCKAVALIMCRCAANNAAHRVPASVGGQWRAWQQLRLGITNGSSRVLLTFERDTHLRASARLSIANPAKLRP